MRGKAKEIYLALRPDGEKGSGKPTDPYDASSPALFNEILYDLRNDFNVCVHIGPGIFQVPALTAIEGGPGWYPRSGWRICGAGMYATVLKIVNHVHDAHCFAIATLRHVNVFPERVTIEDLGIDCNMRSQKDRLVAAGAIYGQGRGMRIRRVRVVDAGTQHIGYECFVLQSAGHSIQYQESRDCVIEDCIVEKPHVNNRRETSVLAILSGEALEPIMGYYRASVIRNCRVDCDFLTEEKGIKEITFSGTTATVRTLQPHNRRRGGWTVISGALVADSLQNPFNGSFQITGIPSVFELTYTMPSIPGAMPTGEIYVGRAPREFISIQNIFVVQSASSWNVTITTATPHYRVPGNKVTLYNIKNLVGSTLEDFYELVEVLSPTVFRIVSTTDPGAGLSYTDGFMGVALLGFATAEGRGAIAERNRIYAAMVGGPYHDTFSSKDLTARKNYHYRVHFGMDENMGKPSGFGGGGYEADQYRAASLIRVGDGRTAKLTTAPYIGSTPVRHGMVPGQPVSIARAFVGGAVAPDPFFNGYFLIEKVLSPTEFTYRMKGDPGANANTSPAPFFGPLWQVGRIIFAKNIVDLIATPLGFINGFFPPEGMRLYGHSHEDPIFVFKQAIFRGNIIRTLNDVIDPPAIGVQVGSVQGGIIESNIIAPAGNLPVQQYRSTTKQFNNTTPSGNILQASISNVVPTKYLNDLEQDIQLALAAGVQSQ